MSGRRQLNEEETRIYAAGMAARKRGESRPKEELPIEQYKLWRAGWRRIGRTVSNSISRSHDHHTLSAGIHCIRTDVETFDDALKVFDHRQRSKKAAQTLAGRPPTWRQELGAHKGRANSPIGHALVPAQSDSASELERHIIGRVVAAIESLKIGVEEMSMISAMSIKLPAVNPKSLMDIVATLCKAIKQPLPEYNVQRTPLQRPPTLRHCIECGTELETNEREYCRHCNPETKSLRIASEMRREHHAKLVGLESDAKQLGRLINKLNRKVINHDNDQGHSGHPSEIVGGMETGGREKDVLVGSETPHQSSARGPGDAKG